MRLQPLQETKKELLHYTVSIVKEDVVEPVPETLKITGLHLRKE